MGNGRLFILSAAVATLAGAGVLVPHPAQAQNDPLYTIKDGKVDQHVYNGYRRYTESCLRCHGPDGAGSSYAPDLTDSLKRLTYDQFTSTVINGRVNVNASSNNVMPAFGTAQDVVENMDDIYSYLKARSDGAQGRGRPVRIGDDQN